MPGCAGFAEAVVHTLATLQILHSRRRMGCSPVDSRCDAVEVDVELPGSELVLRVVVAGAAEHRSSPAELGSIGSAAELVPPDSDVGDSGIGTATFAAVRSVAARCNVAAVPVEVGAVVTVSDAARCTAAALDASEAVAMVEAVVSAAPQPDAGNSMRVPPAEAERQLSEWRVVRRLEPGQEDAFAE